MRKQIIIQIHMSHEKYPYHPLSHPIGGWQVAMSRMGNNIIANQVNLLFCTSITPLKFKPLITHQQWYICF